MVDNIFKAIRECLIKRTPIDVAANLTLTVKDSGKTFYTTAADIVFSLPAVTAEMKGVWFRFINGALSTGTGLSISPSANDYVGGGGFTIVNDKDLINSGASDVVGDHAEIWCNGVDWIVVNTGGTWAKQA